MLKAILLLCFHFILFGGNYFNIRNSNTYWKEIFVNNSWRIAQPFLYINQIKESIIPFPPLYKQKRINAENEKQFTKNEQSKRYFIFKPKATEQTVNVLLNQTFEVKQQELA